MGGSIFFSGQNNIGFKITTENAAIARRVFSLLKVKFGTQTELSVRKNSQLKKNNIYSIVVPSSLGAEDILKETGIISENREKNEKGINYGIPSNLIERENCKKAYLRGAFLGGGSISDPEKTYHLEFVSYSENYSKELCKLINSYELSAKIVQRKNSYVVYLKEGE